MPTMLDEIRERASAEELCRWSIEAGGLEAMIEHDAQDAAMLRVVEAAVVVPEDVWMVILRGLLHAEGYSDDERAGMMSLVVGLHQATSALTRDE